MRENLRYLNDIVQKIKSSPKKYLDEISIRSLYIFLEGFMRCQNQLLGDLQKSYKDFNIFVAEHFNENENQGWAGIIYNNTQNEIEAMEVFYQLIDVYIRENRSVQDKTINIKRKYQSDLFKIEEIHYTNHGNPRKFENPHVHQINYFSFPEKEYYFINNFDSLKKSEFLYYHANHYNEKFKKIDEFVYNICRGGEVEFCYKGINYSITHPDNVLTFTIIDSCIDIGFDDYKALLAYEINGELLKDIIFKIIPYFRTF